MDIVFNEIISPLIDNYPKLVLKLFNRILSTKDVTPDWVTGHVVSIHEDGSKIDYKNYRGITLVSCLGKLFLSILDTRRLPYIIKNNILRPNQLGFVPRNRTYNVHICHKNDKLFSCFVDF